MFERLEGLVEEEKEVEGLEIKEKEIVCH